MTKEEAIYYLEDFLGACDDDDRPDSHDEAIKMAIAALREPKWIPCSERLPQTGTNVLVSYKDNDEHNNRWISKQLCEATC